MNIFVIIGIIIAGLLLVGVVWCCIRINHPQTPEEERALLDQDLKDLKKTIDDRIKKKEAGHGYLL